MQIFQKIIKLSYPLRMKFSKLTGVGLKVWENKNKIPSQHSFYGLKAALNTGEEISFQKYKGKKVLLVNVASQCGYTPQYAQLEKLFREKGLLILGFPANNFGKQEPGNDKEIADFCKLNYGVTFPIFKKADVIGPHKQEVFEWLTDRNRNGWNDTAPRWNFYKYLIDEEGNLEKIFSSSFSPEGIYPLITQHISHDS